MYLGQEILWTETLLCGKIFWWEIFRPYNKSDPWFGLKSLVIPDPILLSPEPFPLSPDPGHILGFEPWAHIPCYDPAKCRAIKYWLKFCEPEHQNKLSGIAFTDQIGQDKNELWPSRVKRLLNLGAVLGDVWSAKTNTPATMSSYTTDS